MAITAGPSDQHEDGSFSSGYLVAPRVVLTVRHGVASATGQAHSSLSVMCLLGPRGSVRLGDPIEARLAWAGYDDLDAALLLLEADPPEGFAPNLVPWGKLVGTQPVRVRSTGLPRAAYDERTRISDTESVGGAVDPGTYAASNRYAINVTAWPGVGNPHERKDQWAGMSGSALFAESGVSVLIGVVAWNEAVYRNRRLTAVPVAALLDDEGFRTALREHLGAVPSLKPVEGAHVRLDALTLTQLNPHTAARRLAHLPDEEAADLLADRNASAADMAEVLRALVSLDEKLAVALLIDVRHDRALELVRFMPPELGWLKELPAAADAIQSALISRRDLGAPTEPFRRASTSPQETQGFYQGISKGQVHWSARAGAQATTGAIAEYCAALDGSRGALGFPLTADEPAGRSSFETEGSYQRFEGPRDYSQDICERLGLRCGATVYWSAKYGAHATGGVVGETHEKLGGTWGEWGFPVTDESEAGPSRSGLGMTGRVQRFEAGNVYYTEQTGIFMVPGPIATFHDGWPKGAAGVLGFPVSPALAAAPSPYGTSGTFQRFEGPFDYPEDILSNWSETEGRGGATVYSSKACGTHMVRSGVGRVYERMGGTGSWLGFPTSCERRGTLSAEEKKRVHQDFEGGRIFWRGGNAFAVFQLVVDLLERQSDADQRLGFPISAAKSLAADANETIQFFEHGVVTVRDGMAEAWMRPSTTPDDADG
ncbi:hypothetical protein J5X84_15640 [Streptosporangiaceae bacterium NEAU-GS5]|nr:hypothetical protein [Streptosporangiaceae bacterium NEAU-GS5]